MPIDLSTVDWVYVGVLSVLVFLATIVGNILSLNHRGVAAILSAIVFAALFVAWTYYPHHLPLPTRLTAQTAATTPAPAAPSGTPGAPSVTPRAQEPARNPVKDITPR